jgi:uncharacterized membrane protein YhaH (DUF805 family)
MLHPHHVTSLLALLQDNDAVNQQAKAIGGMMAGMIGFFMLFGLAVLVFFVFLFWRIFVKAGFAGPLSLIVLFPGIGQVIALCILAFGDWRVVPVPTASPYLPPAYPPPPPPPPSFQGPPQV